MATPVYAIVGEFDDADTLVAAAAKARADGYRKVEAYSPFPVHGLAEALEVNDSKVFYITFIAGLLPVVGNLISNTVILIVSLSQSLAIAVASLAFLVVIHKAEYFLNARIVGARIHAKAWELLVAMLVMEAAFGIAGLIAAPIYYAYLKDELAARKLI